MQSSGTTSSDVSLSVHEMSLKYVLSRKPNVVGIIR